MFTQQNNGFVDFYQWTFKSLTTLKKFLKKNWRKKISGGGWLCSPKMSVTPHASNLFTFNKRRLSSLFDSQPRVWVEKSAGKKYSWNEINHYFFSWNCISGSFNLFPNSKIDFRPFLKLQKMVFGQKKFMKLIYLISWGFFGVDFFKFSGPLWHSKY